jgi:hypothetical protein
MPKTTQTIVSPPHALKSAGVLLLICGFPLHGQPPRLKTWVDLMKAQAAQTAQPQAASHLPKATGTFISFDIAGASGLQPEGISPSGDIAGGYYDTSGVWQNFVLRNGTVHNINPPGAAPCCWAGGWLATENGINPQGDVVGAYSNGALAADGTLGPALGFVLSNGKYTSISPPGAGCFGTIPAGINPQGDIVGFYFDSTSCSVHGFLLSKGIYTNIEVPPSLGALPGSTGASAIDPQGDILGTYSDTSGITHGFLLSHGAFSAIPDIPAPGSFTYPQGMNPQGDIVGAAFVTPCCGFLISHGTISIVDLPGSSETFPYGINPQGDIVGYYIDNNGNQHGFVLRRN